MRSLLALLTLTLLLAAAPVPKRPVDVKTGATDATTEKFADALRAALPAGERVRAQSLEEEDDLSLVLSTVAVDGKKLSWSADLLKVNPGFTPARVGAFAGKCRADALADCARDVVANADRAVRKAEKD